MVTLSDDGVLDWGELYDVLEDVNRSNGKEGFHGRDWRINSRDSWRKGELRERNLPVYFINNFVNISYKAS